MEFQFQKQQKDGFSATKQTTFRSRSGANKSKFVGVRQRPSGKWVAEIKNTTQKIRMWLGTFDTAEEAARAYDEAACLLRGSNTRTNFANHGPANSPLSLKIRNLLNQKKATKQSLSFTPKTTTNTTIGTSTKTTSHTSSGPHSSTISDNTCSCNNSPVSSGLKQVTQMFDDDDAYKPDLRNCNGGLGMGYAHFDHPFTTEFDSLLSTQDGFEVPKRIGLVPETESSEPQIPEFEHMKVERQISASLYAMNGVNEYWENVHDSSDVFWDLPMLYQMICPS